MTGEGKKKKKQHLIHFSKFTVNKQNLKQRTDNPPSVILSILTYFLPVSVIYILSVFYYYYSLTEITRPWKF